MRSILILALLTACSGSTARDACYDAAEAYARSCEPCDRAEKCRDGFVDLAKCEDVIAISDWTLYDRCIRWLESLDCTMPSGPTDPSCVVFDTTFNWPQFPNINW